MQQAGKWWLLWQLVDADEGTHIVDGVIVIVDSLGNQHDDVAQVRAVHAAGHQRAQPEAEEVGELGVAWVTALQLRAHSRGTHCNQSMVRSRSCVLRSGLDPLDKQLA